MNTELYIAKRMLKSSSSEKGISRPIVWLAIAGITLGIAVMILSVSIATGFQKEIRDKVIGFGSHIQITEGYSNFSFESSPMLTEQLFLHNLLNDSKIKHIQNIAYKPAIIQSKEGVEVDGKEVRDIQGVVFKGVDNTFDKDFFNKNLVLGKFPLYSEKGINDSIVISNFMAKKLQLNLHDKIAVFFIKEDGPKQRNLLVSGIYETGLEDFDKQFAIIDINHIRKLNNWGISAHLMVNSECENGYPVIEAYVTGGNGNYRYSWNEGSLTESNKISLSTIKDTTIMLVTTDFKSEDYLTEIEPVSIPDTAWISIKTVESFDCKCEENNYSMDITSINDSSNIYSINGKEFTTTEKTSGGSGQYYTGAIEVLLHQYEDLFDAKDYVQQYVTMEYNVSSITERNEEIFNWLAMLDMNVYIIIGLMVLVAVINMTAALLVLILERTQMIGILKALGSINWSIRKIFLYNGGYLITKGILYGNILALGLIFLQNQFEIITLPQSNYYVSVVPMAFPIITILLVNLGAFIVCFLALILPSYMITRISPVKAIRFE